MPFSRQNQCWASLRLIDPSGKLFPKRKATVLVPLLRFLGGDHNIRQVRFHLVVLDTRAFLIPAPILQYAWHIVDQMRQLENLEITVGRIVVRFNDRQFCVADHHMLWFLGAVPSGRSPDRDVFARSIAEYLGIVQFQDKPDFSVNGLLSRYLHVVCKCPLQKASSVCSRIFPTATVSCCNARTDRFNSPFGFCVYQFRPLLLSSERRRICQGEAGQG